MENPTTTDNVNFSNEVDESVRLPDDVKVEQLVECSSLFPLQFPLTEEEEINMVILSSIQDQKKIQNQQDEYEENILQKYEEMKVEREKELKGLILALKKLAKYDKKVKEVLDLIENIIESYCLGYMNECSLDVVTYDIIFCELSSIRIDKSVIEKLKTIIKSE